mmetsp:Transcript_3106/g.6455  ORF Transcript_3106/g.6455 Transcript_3106/m.6455 type:complete len:264 (-) Transcript_3106:336-1127(-)
MSDSSDYTEDESSLEIGKGRSSFPFFSREAQLVPYRMEQVVISWVFIVASVALILDFVSLQDLVRNIGAPGGPNKFDELCNWFGVVSCLGWLLGFIILAHWLHSVGATSMGLLGCCLKVIASVLFNLQPMTGTMNDPMLGGASGLWWSNLTGITFFHVGNCISCLDFYLHTPPGASKSAGWLYHGNLPIFGMWVYQGATWLLLASNFMACTFNGHFDWAPVQPIASMPVLLCQLGGGFGLLAGSIIYAMWCDGLTNFAHPPLA